MGEMGCLCDKSLERGGCMRHKPHNAFFTQASEVTAKLISLLIQLKFKS